MSDYGLDLQQLRVDIVRRSLTHIGLWSQAAENLVLGTALTESRARYLRQLGTGVLDDVPRPVQVDPRRRPQEEVVARPPVGVPDDQVAVRLG